MVENVNEHYDCTFREACALLSTGTACKVHDELLDAGHGDISDNPWKVQQMESCIAANFHVQDSFQRMDKLLSPVLLKVLRPEHHLDVVTPLMARTERALTRIDSGQE